MSTLTPLAVSLSLGLSCAFPVAATAATDAETSPKVTADAKQKTSFLFVLNAKTGVIAKTNEGDTLTLKGMDDKVLYFSDRPVRKAGFITMSQFTHGWVKGQDSFQDDPPNVAMVHADLETNKDGVAQATAIELSNPVATENGWSFSLKVLQGKISAGTYHGISVFLDSGPWQGGAVGKIIKQISTAD